MSAAGVLAAAEVRLLRRGDADFPRLLAASAGAPAELYVAGGVERLGSLLAQPAVALVGSRAGSDYGMEVAYGLARGLAASGVTVLGGLAEGIASAAHAGALAGCGSTVTVMPGGLDRCYPASRAALYRRVREVGCAVSEWPCGTAPSRWSHAARARILAGLAQLVVVVESEDHAGTLAPARLAEADGRRVGAVPGRVVSRLSRGPHALLAQGAGLVRDAQDALDLLYGVGARVAAEQPRSSARLDTGLRDVLERVACGEDTVAKLTARGEDRQEVLVALAELELLGMLAHGDGGRYLACM